MQTKFNDLVQYVNSGHPLDPDQVKLERERLAGLLNDLGARIGAGESYEFDFSGKVVATVVNGLIEVSIVGANGTPRAGDICNAMVALDGQSMDNVRVCPSCGNHFVSQKGTRKYCGDACARRVWNRNMREKRQAGEPGAV